MNKLNTEDIEKLADLAKIELGLGDAENFLKDINNILGHLAMVGEADTTGVSPTLNFYNNLRHDHVDTRDFQRDLILSNIPNKSKDNFVKVSKVIKK